MTKFTEGNGFAGDKRDMGGQSVDALSLLKKCVVDRPPRYEDLPRSITLHKQLAIMPESRENKHIETQSIDEVSGELLNLQDEYGIEFGRGIVADHEDDLLWGPYCKGNEHSVSISAPLKQTEILTPSGLYAFRHDKIVATVHSHPGDHSFSLQDFYADLSQGHKQMYVIRNTGVLDMVQVSDDTRFLNEDAFQRLLSLWSTYLLPNGEFRPDLSPKEHSEFLHRISESVLKIGFYSNEYSEDSGALQLMEWKK